MPKEGWISAENSMYQQKKAWERTYKPIEGQQRRDARHGVLHKAA
jgi:hypothetical protein